MCQDNKQLYSPLHLHSQYSIDSVTSIKELHNKAKEMGFKAIAITDHASMSGAVEHYLEGQKSDVKPILGCEIYLFWDTAMKPEWAETKSGKKRLAHLTLLCNGEQGYETLVNLVNRAKVRAEYGFRSPVYMSELIKENEGLICLTGCPASFAQDLDKELAFEFVRQLQDAFGDRLYSEGQFHNLETPRHFDRAIEISNTFSLPLVYTNDCHFLDQNNVTEYARFKKWVFGGKEDEDENFSLTMLYLADSKEVLHHARQISGLAGRDYMPFVHEGFENSIKISDMLEIVPMEKREPIFPVVDDAEQKFNEMIVQGIKDRNIDMDNSIYKDRLENEIRVIKNKGFIPYFVVVADLCLFSREKGLIQGVGRGSAAGSLVSYILGITHLDPIKYGLTFERFLSEHRNALPDIDSDFSGGGRDRILEYAGRKYGMKPNATFIYFGKKEALNFAARHCGVPFQDIELAKSFLDEANLGDEHDEADDDYLPREIINLFKKYENVRLKEMFEFVFNKLKSVGQHPGGISYVDKTAPLENKTNGGIVVALPEGSHGEYLSHRGFVKVDILGINSLEILENCYNIIGKLPPEPIGEEPAIELLTQENAGGIFQFKGDTMTSLIRKFKPKTFIDLVVLNAAGRGGADTDKYLEMRDTKSKIVWENEIDAICEKTFGIPIFQEDFMHIYAFLLDTVFDDPLGRVDKMRKSIAKYRKTPEGIKKKNELKNEILELSKNKGLNNEKSKLLWHFFELAHGYSFNLAHSTCYSYISWQLLWYKYNHNLIFQAAVLNSAYQDDLQRTIDELQAEGVHIVEPDINVSKEKWIASVPDNKLYAPFGIIKSVGELASEEIIKNQPFESAKQLMDTCNLRRLNSGVRYKLWACGVLNSLPDITNDIEKDGSILEIEKYDLAVNKENYKNDVFVVSIIASDVLNKIKNEVERLQKIVFTDKEEKVIKGTVYSVAREHSKNPKLKGDMAIQYKVRTKDGKFLGWFSHYDLKKNLKLSMVKQGATIIAITSYGRLIPEYISFV